MSTTINSTMQNPLDGVQSAHFRQAVEIARKERTRVLHKLADMLFGRLIAPKAPTPEQAEIDKANAIPADMLRYGRPF